MQRPPPLAIVAAPNIHAARSSSATTDGRRALLVSALAYVLIALTALLDKFGVVELSVALTALVIGSALLTLSAFWDRARRAIVRRLPEALRERLPTA